MTVGSGYLREGAENLTTGATATNYIGQGSAATAPNSKLIPVFYSNKILKKFYEKVIFSAVCNTD